jgi:hypothetical protein
MNTAREPHVPVTDLDRHARPLAQARDGAAVVVAVRDYLAGWPAACVLRVQQVDGGWAPFDAHQRPTPVYRVEDVRRIFAAVERQCAALRDAGVALGPELLALDRFLHLACARLAQLEPESPAAARALAGANAVAGPLGQARHAR